jgi:hypothetical protein
MLSNGFPKRYRDDEDVFPGHVAVLFLVLWLFSMFLFVLVFLVTPWGRKAGGEDIGGHSHPLFPSAYNAS